MQMFDELNIDWGKLHWQSDWDGDDIGYPYSTVIGYYTYYDLNLYIDIDSLQILEAWFDDEDNEEF